MVRRGCHAVRHAHHRSSWLGRCTRDLARRPLEDLGHDRLSAHRRFRGGSGASRYVAPLRHRRQRREGCPPAPLEAQACSGRRELRRRVLWLLPHGRDFRPQGLYATGALTQAVDPRTPAPGGKGARGRTVRGPPAVSDGTGAGGGAAAAAVRPLGIPAPVRPHPPQRTVQPVYSASCGPARLGVAVRAKWGKHRVESALTCHGHRPGRRRQRLHRERGGR
ncbi:DUF6009 family protein [Streptomyces griseoincarnatus]